MENKRDLYNRNKPVESVIEKLWKSDISEISKTYIVEFDAENRKRNCKAVDILWIIFS